MYPTTENVLKVCRKCEIQHAVNCSDCFGFGRFVGASEPCGGWVPISAERAHLVRNGELDREPVRCPTCGGHPLGRIPPPGVEEIDATEDDTRIG